MVSEQVEDECVHTTITELVARQVKSLWVTQIQQEGLKKVLEVVGLLCVAKLVVAQDDFFKVAIVLENMGKLSK